MRLGAALPVSTIGGGPLAPGSLAASAGLLERLGYRSIWVFDAVGRGFALPDPFIALAVAATATNSVELGSGIVQLPIRNVAEVAHRAMTLQMLAGPRVLLGIGPGSTEADFRTFGADYRSRFSRFDEQRTELEQWLSAGAVDDRTLSPWPAAVGGPPILLAGWRGPWVERAASEAAGWIASGANADDATLADAIDRYRQAGGQRAVVTNVQVGSEVAPVIDRIAYLTELGFDDIVVFDVTPTEDRLAEIRTAVDDTDIDTGDAGTGIDTAAG
jgi:alkanesulfonate monooxygenase SsuD/methylene tetrahydromethanopterin reductase-like flavin-dependent oxidoreductase (luciferase family)